MIQKTQAYSLLQSLKKKKKPFFLTLFFDLLLIIVFGFTGKLISIALGSPSAVQNLAASWGISTILMGIAVYYLVILLIYSFFKFAILQVIAGMYKKDLPWQHFWSFFGLNLIILPVFIGGTLFILTTLFRIFEPAFFRVIGAIFLLAAIFYYYPLVNLSHTEFAFRPKVKSALKGAWQKIKKARTYIGIYAYTVAILAVFFAVMWIISLFLKSIDPRLNMLVFSLFTLIVVYLLLAFNRISFYTRRNVLS